jgi:hypothetical protein
MGFPSLVGVTSVTLPRDVTRVLTRVKHRSRRFRAAGYCFTADVSLHGVDAEIVLTAPALPQAARVNPWFVGTAIVVAATVAAIAVYLLMRPRDTCG